MAVLTIHHYLDIIKRFISNVESSKDTYYMFVGKPDPWLNPAGQDDDSSNNITSYHSANGSVYQHESSIYRDMVFGKLITPSDIEYLAPRIDWVANTVYDQYDQFDPDLYSKNFYVVTDAMDVFKVIDNGSGAASTIKPSLTSQTGTFETSDGYTWKYMYTIDVNSNTKFTTSSFIPVVPNNSVVANAVGGSIDVIRLVNGGNGYPYYTGSLIASTNNKVVIIDENASYSNNYYTGSSMYLEAGYGAGQIRKIIKYDGLNKLVTLESPFNRFATFNLADIVNDGSFVVNNTLTQNVDTLAVLYTKGIFQVGDTIVQSDTGAVADIVTANSTVFKTIKTATSNAFALVYPVYNTSQSGSLKTGTVAVGQFTDLTITSNTGAFTVGEWLYQSNGSANTANGVVFSANSSRVRVGRVSGSFSNSYQVKGNTSSSNAAVSLVSANNEGNAYAYSTNTAQTAFTTDFAINDYIRIGDDANTNIRRITAVNTSLITLDSGLSAAAISNTYYKIAYAFIPTSITLNKAYGTITNTNIYGVKIDYANKTNLAINYIVGEKVDMVNSSNTSQGVSGIVSYSNSTTVVLSSVTGGSFSTSFYLRGESSLQKADISTVDSYPNITISDPTGTFISGIPVNTRDVNDNILGSANVLSYFIIPNQLTQYVITPTIVIDGDGSNAIAFATVDTSNTSTGAIKKISVLNPGYDYTFANVTIVSNTFHANGATATAVVSPVTGHGSSPLSELGARYAGITMTIANGQSESYKFPLYGKYRRIGLIKNPLYNDLTVNLDSFDRVRLSINTVSGAGFSTNEYILQSNSGAIGKVIFANSSHLELNAVQGTFSANMKFANSATANDNILGLTSLTTANVATSNVIYFSVLSDVETVSEVTSGANAIIVTKVSNTQLKLTNVGGRMVVNDTLYDATTNAYANVVSLYTSNSTIDVSASFATKFAQILRFPLTTNTAPFQQFEKVTQEFSNASGMIISNNNEFDIKYTSANGTFSTGDYVRNSTNTAYAILTFANTTYLRLTAANGTFSSGDTIINNLNKGATVTNAFSVLVLSDINGSGLFSSGGLSGNVTGSITGTTGKCAMTDVIQYPDLVENTGEVTYLENISSLFELSNTSKETVKLVIKF